MLLSFRDHTRFDNSVWLRKLNEEVKKINNSDKIIVNADKTGNKYEISASNYQRLMHDNLTRDYKLDDGCNLSDINNDTRRHAHSLDIADRIECHSQANAFLTIKDHREDFPNTIKCKVINPACKNLGKVSKRVLDNINTACREAAGVNQWKSTQEVLRWFSDRHANNLQNLHTRIFILTTPHRQPWHRRNLRYAH